MKSKILKIILSQILVFSIGFAKEYQLDYHDFEHLNINDKIPNEGSIVYVYFYSIQCYYCKTIKQDVLDFALRTNEFYFIDITGLRGVCPFISGGDCIKGTPTLIIFGEDKELVQLSGARNIADYIFSI